MKKIIILILVVTSLMLGSAAIAGDITVAWDPNPPAENVTNYKIDWGTVSRIDPAFTGYPNSVDVGNFLEHTLSALPDGVYYIAARAQNSAGLISDYSIELTATIDTPANVPPGVPTNFRIITISYPTP